LAPSARLLTAGRPGHRQRNRRKLAHLSGIMGKVINSLLEQDHNLFPMVSELGCCAKGSDPGRYLERLRRISSNLLPANFSKVS